MRYSIARLARTFALAGFTWASGALAASTQSISLQCDPAQTTAKFTLGDSLHTVHGAFKVKRCDIRFDPASSKLEGEIVFDATSGESGNASRDRKMQKNVLESARYPEIAFRPGRLEGNVAPSGTSLVQVSGLFGIHGAEHEITVPVEVDLEADHWTASAHFPVPYVKWGMKNPSILFLRVGDTVTIDFQGTGGTKPDSP